jgi:catechol 2,3-dioxygenase-like lactoylglutathione lyase family enzyme
MSFAAARRFTVQDAARLPPAAPTEGDRAMEYKLELVVIPVTDVDRAKAFYTDQAGFRLDVDTRISDQMRIVQATPPGSACSIGFGTGLTQAEPGSAPGLQLVVCDIVAAREELTGRGVDVSEVRHLESGVWVPGPHPQRSSYESFAGFSDLDGNTWVLQEVRRDGQGE